MAVYSGICLIFSFSKIVDTFIAITIALFTLIMLCPIFTSKKKEKYLLSMIILSICVNAFLLNSIEGKKYASEAVDIKQLQKYDGVDESKAVKSIAKKEKENLKTIRFSGRNLTHNANLTTGISSTNYYWSISNPYVSEYRSELEMREVLNQLYEGYDDRTVLNTLSGVTYFVIKKQDKNPIPYGYKYIKTVNLKKESQDYSYKIYKNENRLPLVYTYDNYIKRNQWNEMNAVDKESSMLQSVILDDDKTTINQRPIQLSSKKIPYNIKYNSPEVSLQNNQFVVTSENASITLEFKGIEKSETYLTIKGLDYEPTCAYDLYFGEQRVDPLNLYTKNKWNELLVTKQAQILRNKFYWSKPNLVNLTCVSSNNIKKVIGYRTNENQYYIGRHNFTTNFGYSEKAINSATITFEKKGIYSFESIGIICNQMNGYEEQVQNLKRDKINSLDFYTDNVKCNITLGEPKIMVFSIPYSKGWEAVVDGKKTNIFKANIKNIGLEIDKGSHIIELHYKMPLLKQGALVSLATLLIIIGFVFIFEIKRKHYDKVS